MESASVDMPVKPQAESSLWQRFAVSPQAQAMLIPVSVQRREYEHPSPYQDGTRAQLPSTTILIPLAVLSKLYASARTSALAPALCALLPSRWRGRSLCQRLSTQ
eukprot:3939159-Rhodomonas_salina.1